MAATTTNQKLENWVDSLGPCPGTGPGRVV